MLKFIFKYALKFWWQILIMLALSILSSQINLELPKYTSKIINEGVAHRDLAHVYALGWQMIGFSILSGTVMILSMFFSTRIAAGIARNLREATFAKIESFSLKEFGKFSVASLITRITNDASQFQQTFSMTLRMGTYAIFIGVGAIINVFTISASMSWIVVGTVAAILLMAGIIISFALPRLKIVQENVDALNLQTRQTITGLRIIRAFRNDTREEQNFAKINQRNFKTNLFIDRIFGMILPWMTLVGGISSVMVVWVGAYFVKDSLIKVGDIFALMQYVGQVSFAFVVLSMIFAFLPRMVVSVNRIREVQETELKILDAKKPLKKPTDFTIKFDNVSFKYDGGEDYVLQDLNFEIPAGQTVAVIGGTGSGKSTIAKLIPRFFDASKGKISIGGKDVSKLSQQELRELIGYAPQKAMLFSGDIRDNVAYGSDLSDEQIIEALKIAQAWDFVQKLPNDLSEQVSQGGKNFSGGQKQRLSIARAIAKNAPIMIFDDSFSALDYKTDAALRAELAKKTKGKTKFIVAQRVASIAHADQIIVLDGGKIAGIGKHAQLLKNNELYREIASSQFSDEEIAAQIAKFEAKQPAKTKAKSAKTKLAKGVK